MTTSQRDIFLRQHVVLFLMALTIVLLVWQYFGMEREYHVSAKGGQKFVIADDRLDQGESVATLERLGEVLRMRCNIKNKFAWPYCRFTFNLGDERHGIDFSQYDSIEFNVRASGAVWAKGGKRSVRTSLLNYEPAISADDYPKSHKVNEVQFEVPDDGRLVLPLNVIQTAPWWKAQYNIPLIDTDTQLDNVTVIELVTGADAPEGEIVIDFTSIIFHGKWISQRLLLMLIVGTWFAFALVWSIFSASQYRLELRKSKARNDLLSDINRALELETKELAGQAHTDPLTGVLNRQGLRSALMNTSALLADPMSVVFADLDHFKRVNDQHGHEEGDNVLRMFVTSVSSVIRASDKLVRWGGEEFLIVCPNTTADQAHIMAEKIRAALKEQQWPCNERLTASFGIAARLPAEDIGNTIKRADGALYQAKDSGRDRVEVAQ